MPVPREIDYPVGAVSLLRGSTPLFVVSMNARTMIFLLFLLSVVLVVVVFVISRAQTGLVCEHVPLGHPAWDRGEDSEVPRLGEGGRR